MRNILYKLVIILGALLLFSCNMRKDTEKEQSPTTFTGQDGEIRLVVLDPGHFHASLLQKFPQRQVNMRLRGTNLISIWKVLKVITSARKTRLIGR